MPLYEYECRICGTTFERKQRFGDAPAQECPHGHTSVHRIYSPVGIVFKGSGWYITDHRAGSTEAGQSEAKA